MDDDFCARDGVVHEVRNAFAFDGYGHVCADFSAELAYGVVKGHALGVLAVNFTDAVARADA